MNELSVFFQINWLNLSAVLWFMVCFRGYAMYSKHAAKNTHCLASAMHFYRIEWMERMLEREIRMTDTSTIANLERTVAFFASTTILILAGLVTVLGSTEKAINVISDIPFASYATTVEWEMKLLLLVVIFSYAFFKFTWSLRQYGFASIMIGGSPMPTDNINDQARIAFAKRNAHMLSLAANNFNSGLRTYYFSLSVLGWFINTWIFIGVSSLIVWLLYRREFKSRTLTELSVSRANVEN
ncbi:MAG: DUF599 family protein [Candidatus Thiodiazotropha sp. (ex Lucinoma borealis)]|nr:DUF599 family protein [Candidatus Thiodiazotropha sp. (ex Lucinoma borealis)]